MNNEQVLQPDNVELIKNSRVGTSTKSSIAVDDPATGHVIGHVPDLTPRQILRAIESAETAFYKWRDVPLRERCEKLFRWYQLMLEKEEELAGILTGEQGKPLSESRGEIRYAASYIQWYAQPGLQDQGSVLPYSSIDESMIVITEPVGVCAAITPWNFPAAMITRKVAPALAAGCTMLVKPALETPLTAIAIAELAIQAGIPEGVLSIVTGDGEAIGKIFSESAVVRKLSFTGSTRVGRLLMASSASTVKRLSLELGGNAPFIVCETADVERAVQGAIQSKFRNAGQTCVCANAFYVHANVYDEFTEKFIARVNQLMLGNGKNESVDIGPLINENALEKVEKIVADAVKKGAVIACGGERWVNSERWYYPTVLLNADSSMRCVNEEIFGPVAPIVRYDDETALLEELRQQQTGLAAYFYSQNLGQVNRLSRALEVGMIGVNSGVISDAAVPFGGVKSSGIGREGGRHGIEEYLETKYIKLSY